MIVRDHDAGRINAVLNHDSVKPWIMMPGRDVFDISDAVADPRNVVLMLDDGTGGIVFEHHEPGVFEVHTQFLPQSRGRIALDATREALEWMFTRTDAMELLTKCPAHNRAAAALAKRIGGTLDFRREAVWPTEAGPVAVDFYALRYADWVKTAPGLEAYGKWFHDELEAEKARVGSAHEIHDDDLAHDRFVGATVAMILGGQIAKAIVLYNRWAKFAGYAPAEVVSRSPLVIDIQEAWLEVGSGNFRIIRCPVQQ